jgi:hypothetical protein
MLSLQLTGQAPWTAVYTDGTSSWSLGGITGDTSIFVNPSSDRTYTLTTIATNGCIGTSTDDANVSVIPSATPAIAGGSQNLCTNVAQLNGNNPTSGTGQWSVLQGNGMIADVDTNITSVSGLSVGTNVLVWTITAGQCVSSDTIQIQVSIPPTTANAGADQYLCGTSTLLGGNTAVNGNGTWSVVSGLATILDVNDPNSAVINLSLGQTVLEWTIVQGGCVTSDLITLHSALSAPIANAGPDQIVCAGSAILSAASPSVGTGAWFVSGGNALVQDTLNAQSVVSNLNMGANVLIWVTANGGCTGSDTVIITRVEAPQAQFTFTTFGFDVDFINQSTGGAGSYQWTFGDGGSSSSQNPHHTYLQAGEYQVRLIVTNVCRSDTTFGVIRIGGVKNSGFADAGSGITVYPNPATGGHFEVRVYGMRGEQLKLKLYNMLGAEVMRKDIETQGRDAFIERIELSALLSKGTYTLIIESEVGVMTEKLIVQ